MKLLFCPDCTDLLRLFGGEPRACRCGKSAGRYVDDKVVEVSGPAEVLGVGNPDFEEAFRRRQERVDPDRFASLRERRPRRALTRPGTTFKGFFLPDPCQTVRRVTPRWTKVVVRGGGDG